MERSHPAVPSLLSAPGARSGQIRAHGPRLLCPHARGSYSILTAADETSIAIASADAPNGRTLPHLIIISEPVFFQPVHSSEYQVVNVPELGELNPEPSDTNESNNKTDMETNIILSAVIFVLFEPFRSSFSRPA